MSGVCRDLLVAFPPVGLARAHRIAALPESVDVTVALDSLASVGLIGEAARAAGRAVGVYVELDLGMHRVGVPVVDDAVAIARAVCALPPLEFRGIAFYPGHVREHVGEAQSAKLDALANSVGEVIAAFDRAGLHPRVVSGGSTPTLWNTHEIAGITEFLPGTYVYNDRTTAEIGACAWDDCAFTVLATVVSTAVPNQAVIDAGSKALGREPMRGADGAGGFGALLDRPDVTVASMSEEHGILDLSKTTWRPQVGERVRVVPNHVCVVVHLNDVIAGARADVVETTWPVAARGRGYAIGV